MARRRHALFILSFKGENLIESSFPLKKEEVGKGAACRNDSGYDLPLFDKKKLWERYDRMEWYPLLKGAEKSCFISALRR